MDYREKALGDLVSDGLTDALKHEYRARILCVAEIEALTLNDVRSLYDMPPYEEQNAEKNPT